MQFGTTESAFKGDLLLSRIVMLRRRARSRPAERTSATTINDNLPSR